jgi:hypothetical protein
LSRSVKVAFCGMMAAGSVAALFLTGVIPFGRMALAGLAGLLLIAVVTEIGTPWAWSVYAAVSFLSVFLVAYKHAVVAYILVLGCYPILKAVIEKRMKNWSSLVLKLVYFNAAALLDFWVAVTLLSVPRSSYQIFGMNLPWLLLLFANAVFLVYDYALSLIAIGYFERIHPIVRKIFHQ